MRIGNNYKYRGPKLYPIPKFSSPLLMDSNPNQAPEVSQVIRGERKHAPGYNFKTKDVEIVLKYLLRKILKHDTPDVIKESVDFYKYDPDQLPREDHEYGTRPYGDFFYTEREPGSERIAKNGYWEEVKKEEKVMRNNRVVGFKKTMKFYRGKKPSGNETHWILDEYRVNPQLCRREMSDRVSKYVLCRIYRRYRSNFMDSDHKRPNSKSR